MTNVLQSATINVVIPTSNIIYDDIIEIAGKYENELENDEIVALAALKELRETNNTTKFARHQLIPMGCENMIDKKMYQDFLDNEAEKFKNLDENQIQSDRCKSVSPSKSNLNHEIHQTDEVNRPSIDTLLTLPPRDSLESPISAGAGSRRSSFKENRNISVDPQEFEEKDNDWTVQTPASTISERTIYSMSRVGTPISQRVSIKSNTQSRLDIGMSMSQISNHGGGYPAAVNLLHSDNNLSDKSGVSSRSNLTIQTKLTFKKKFSKNQSSVNNNNVHQLSLDWKPGPSLIGKDHENDDGWSHID